MLLGVLVGTALFQGWAAFFTLRVFWLALALLFVMGLIDDCFSLSPMTKLAVQLASAALFVMLLPPGIWGGELESVLGGGAFVIWILWLVGMTNAVNLLDNIDGLTPATGLAAALGFLWLGDGSDWILMPMAGALAGFLCLNAYRARIHLGDSGSHLVGFSLATLPLFGLPWERAWIPALVLIVPIADTTFVTISRIRRGVSPFLGGKDHLSHRLVRRGWPSWLVMVLAAGVTWLMVLVAAALR